MPGLWSGITCGYDGVHRSLTCVSNTRIFGMLASMPMCVIRESISVYVYASYTSIPYVNV